MNLSMFTDALHDIIHITYTKFSLVSYGMRKLLQIEKYFNIYLFLRINIQYMYYACILSTIRT